MIDRESMRFYTGPPGDPQFAGWPVCVNADDCVIGFAATQADAAAFAKTLNDMARVLGDSQTAIEAAQSLLNRL
jgi:hypothetical protein